MTDLVAFLVPACTTATAPRSSPGHWGSWSTLPPDLCPVSPGTGLLRALGSRAGKAGWLRGGQGHLNGCTCAEPPPGPAATAASPPPPQPPAPQTREKSKQRRTGFCSIRGAGGGKSMFSKWEKRKSFRKDSLFPSWRGVRKQHRPLRRKPCGPSTPQAEQCALS